jgi:BlaI family penicillinase repressor
MATTTPSISDAEWEVMAVLWDTSPLTANDVVDRLAARRRWSPRTVKTLLNRLVKKGALKFQVEGKRYSYRPAVQRQQSVRAESRSFLSRVFRGAAGPMLVHFVTHAELTPGELKELEEALAARKQRQAGGGGRSRA